MAKIVFTNFRLLDGKEDMTVREGLQLYVNGEKIEDIVPNKEPIREGYSLVDLNGMYLLPGLVNLHVHLFGTGRPSKVLGGGQKQKRLMKLIKGTHLGKVVVRSLVNDNLKTILKSGVTTVRSVGDFVYSDVYERNHTKNDFSHYPTLLCSGAAITSVGGHGDGTFSDSAVAVSDLKKYVDDRAAHKTDWIKICVTGGVMDAKVKGEPGIVKMTAEQTKAVCDEAHKLGYRVASHTESPDGVEIAIHNGVDTIEHGAKMKDETIQLAKKRNCAFVVTFSPAVPLNILDSDVTKLNDLCRYNSGVVMDGMISAAKQSFANGIRVGMGTDASCPFCAQYGFYREIMYFKKYLGVSSSFALHTATQVNADILGLGNEIGTVEKGKYADLLVVQENPLDDLAALSRPVLVMHRGAKVRNLKVERIPIIEENLDKMFAAQNIR
jgi:imidazolonepropionase-like amidohydrolase